MKTRIGFKTALVWILAFLVLLLIFPYSINAQIDIGPLLPEDLLISDSQHLSGRTNVAFDGTKYLVVWTQLTDPFTTRFDVYGRFVDTAGEALAPTFRIGWTSIDDVMPDVAFNGDYFLVVWENVLELRCQVVGTDGQLIGTTPLIISSLDEQNREPAVATDGSDFLVVWRHYHLSSGHHIFGQFVGHDENGNPYLISSSFLVSPENDYHFLPSIAYGIGSYLVTWTFERVANPGDLDVQAAFVDTYGVVYPPVTVATEAGNFLLPAETEFDGTNYLIVYNKELDLYGRRFMANGTPLDEEGFLISHISYIVPLANVAFGDGEYLVVWGGNEIMGTRVSLNGDVLDSPAINLSVMTGAEQSYPALAFDGENYLVTWEQGTARSKYAQLVGLTYQTPEEMLVDLFEEVLALSEEYNIPEGSLNLLETASSALEDANTNNDVSAIKKLNAFISQVVAHRNNGDIPVEEANALIAAAQAIIDELESQ